VLVPRSRHLRPVLAAVAAAALLGAVTGTPAVGAATTTAQGAVFWVNPVQSSGDESLTDRKDSATAVPAADYRPVTLTGLDGSGYLRGQWANVVSETGDPAFAPAGGSYIYNRADDRFEQVMAYYWVTQAQLYLQGLGFGTGELPPVNMESQDVRINQYGADNSFSWDKKDLLRFGKGGVDDAEDAEVIVHEYGHAVHDAQVPGFGTSLDAGSIGEAFGDYLAVSVGLAVAGQPAKGVPAACVMDWDATSYTSTVPHCLRRIDTNLHYPEDLDGEVHDDGRIWSRALWDIRQSLGNIRADTIILKGQIDFPGTTMTDLATRTVAAAKSLYGNSAASKVTAAFEARGIL
jgi:zinc metalloprotease ZmpB